MQNQYYLKDKRLSVWSFTTQVIKGVTTKVYQKEYSLIWAYYRHNRGTAALEGSDLRFYDENAAALFVINKREIQAPWLIAYNHKIYEITRIDDFEGYQDDIKVYCKLASNQNFSAYRGLEDD